MTAAEMVRQRVCCAVCLVAAVAPESCSCPCAGRWHGVLADARVPGTAGERNALPAPRPEPELLFDMAPPAARGAPDPWHCQDCGHHWPPVDGEGNACPECGGRGGFHPARMGSREVVAVGGD